MQALTRGAPGTYNIVDDEPAPLREWLPFTARLLKAPQPGPMAPKTAREKLGDMACYVLNEQSGASNARACHELDWLPRTPSWRTGFAQLYGGA